MGPRCSIPTQAERNYLNICSIFLKFGGGKRKDVLASPKSDGRMTIATKYDISLIDANQQKDQGICRIKQAKPSLDS